MNQDDIYPSDNLQYRDEAIKRWGEDSVKKSEARIEQAGPERLRQANMEGEAIVGKLVDLMEADPASDKVQQLIERFYQNKHFYIEEIPLEMFRGWGQMYAADPRFRANYEKYAEGLADFVSEAISIYCDSKAK